MKMASSFRDRKEQLIFVINNYDIILSIMSEKTHNESHEAEYFRHQFSARISEYVEEILQPFTTGTALGLRGLVLPSTSLSSFKGRLDLAKLARALSLGILKGK